MTSNSRAELQVNAPIGWQKKKNWWPPAFHRMRPVTSMCPADPPKSEGNPRHMQRDMLQPGAQTEGCRGGGRENSRRHGPKPQDPGWDEAPGFPTSPYSCRRNTSTFDNLRRLVGWISGLMGALATKRQDAWRCFSQYTQRPYRPSAWHDVADKCCGDTTVNTLSALDIDDELTRGVNGPLDRNLNALLSLT